MSETGNGWFEWKNVVMRELDRLDKAKTELRCEVQEIKVMLATLQVKSGMWGGIGALIPIVVAFLIYILTKVI